MAYACELLCCSAQELASRISKKEISAKILLEVYIERIERVNPAINAVVAKRYEEARKEALIIDQMIDERENSEALLEKKPLLGVPVTIKDCFAVTGLPHTAGLVKRSHIIAEEDATVVKNIRSAGGIIVGVTNCSELCMWFETTNKLYGTTNNPYGLAYGGEGAIIAAGGSICGVGSDIGGSVRMPAFLCGCFGHKASANLGSLKGSWPPVSGPAKYCEGPGPICRYSVDIPLVMDVVLGLIPRDPESISVRAKSVDIRSLKVVSVLDMGGTSFGISNLDAEIKAAQIRVEQHLQKEYGLEVERTTVPNLQKSTNVWLGIVMEDDGPRTCELLANCSGRISPFWELLKSAFGQSDHMFPSLLQAAMDHLSGPPKIGEANAEAHRKRDELKEELEQLIGEHGVLLYPTFPKSPLKHGRALLNPYDFSYSAIFNALGFPVTAIPLGLNEKGFPIGIQIVSTGGNDHLTIAAAMAIEESMEECGWKVPPNFPIS